MGDSEEDQVFDLSMPAVVEKYKSAAKIANLALERVTAAAVAGAKIFDLCTQGDSIITEESAKVYKAAKFEKGIAFPTCVSPNHVAGHMCPLTAEESQVLADGDVVKIDLGAHVDGFVAMAAHTIVVGAGTEGNPITGRAADCIKAAQTAAELSLRAIQPGKTNKLVTPLLEQTVSSFDCVAVEGVTSHNVKRFDIDGDKMVMNKNMPSRPVPEVTFEANEVYVVDVVVSSGEGKAKETAIKPTVFRKTGHEYQLKVKASRAFYSELKKNYPRLPFSLRDSKQKFQGVSEPQQRLGLNECLQHQLLHPFPVLSEKTDAVVAQFKFTMLLLPSGASKITGLPYPVTSTEKDVTDEVIKGILATEPRKKRRDAKK